MHITARVKADTPGLKRYETVLQKRTFSEAVGASGVADIKRNLSTNGTNLGRPWPPLQWREGGKLKKGVQGPIQMGKRLRDSGNLARSIHFELDGDNINIVASKTTAGKKGTVNIAAVQHFGAHIKITKKMYWFLGLAMGKWLSRKKTHIDIPATGFMTFSDRFKGNLQRLIARDFQTR